MDSEGSTRGRRVCTLQYGVLFFTNGRTDGTRAFDEGRVEATRASERRDPKAEARDCRRERRRERRVRRARRGWKG